MAEESKPLTRQDLLEVLAVFGDQLRAEMRSELSALRAEMRTEMSALRTELRTEMSALRTELRAEIQASAQQVTDQLTELVRDVETHLLTDFHRYAKGITQRLHTLDTADHEVKERLHLLEERVLELESRIRPSYGGSNPS